MDRIEKLNQQLRHWQKVLKLEGWDLKIKLTEFNRTDYDQTGDIEVDSENKSAVVLIIEEETGKDSAIILHELIHLLLWDYDQYCGKNITAKNKDKYFDLLERTVADLTTIFLQKDK